MDVSFTDSRDANEWNGLTCAAVIWNNLIWHMFESHRRNNWLMVGRDWRKRGRHRCMSVNENNSELFMIGLIDGIVLHKWILACNVDKCSRWMFPRSSFRSTPSPRSQRYHSFIIGEHANPFAIDVELIPFLTSFLPYVLEEIIPRWLWLLAPTYTRWYTAHTTERKKKNR